MLNMIAIYGTSTNLPEGASNAQLFRQAEMWKARAFFELKEKKQLTDQHKSELAAVNQKCKGELAAINQKYKGELAAVNQQWEERLDRATKEHKEEKFRLEKKIAEIDKELTKAQELLANLQKKKGAPLKYSDLFDGGILSNHVEAFTLFDTIEQNDAFLELINFTDSSEGSLPVGDGLCENLRQYTDVSPKERAGKVPPPTMDHNSEEYKRHLNKFKAARKPFGRT